MAQVFIAYKRPDADQVARVREKLVVLGVELFVDHQIKGGDNYIAVINDELNSALAALVFWSKAAVALPKPGQQNFLMAEAQKGWRRDILVAATFDKVVLDNLPVPFNTYQTSDLSDWFDGGMPAGHSGWQRLLDSIGVKIGRPGLSRLALVLESGDEHAKRRFVREFSADIFAERFADEIVGAERAAFEKAVAAAQSQIDRRRRDAEKILKECRNQFDSQIVRLRKGEPYVQPDPVKMLADDITAVRDQNEIYEAKLDGLQSRIEDSKLTSAQANERIDELAKQLDTLGQQYAIAQAAAAEAGQLHADFERLQQDRLKTADQLTERGKEIEGLKSSLAQALQTIETAKRDLTKSQSDCAQLKQQLPNAPWSIWKYSPHKTVAAGGVVGLILGAALVVSIGVMQTRGNFTLAGNLAEIPTSRMKEPAAAQDEQLKKRVVASLDLTESAQPKNSEIVRLNSLSKKCDTYAGEQYDRDRPQDAGWSKDIEITNLTLALRTCREELADAKYLVDQRRLHMEIGRLLYAQAIKESDKNPKVAHQLAADALDSLEMAKKLGSAHAYYILGRYYLGNILYKTSATGELVPAKDTNLAWDNILAAAKLNDPQGLTTAALNLIMPDYGEKIVKAEPSMGIDYLLKALQSDDPHAHYVAGRAQLDGKIKTAIPGLPMTNDEAMRELEIASCKGDLRATQEYLQLTRTKPNCS